MTTTHDGTKVLKGAAVTLVALAGGLAGGVWWFFATFTLEEGGPSHSARVTAAEGLAGAAAVVLMTGLGLARLVRAPSWSLVPIGLVSVALAVATAYQLTA